MRPGRGVVGCAVDAGAVGVEVDDAGAVLGQALAQRSLGNEDRRSGVGEHEGEALWRIVGVERQVGGAGLEDAEERDHHVERALDAEPDDGLRSGAERAQVVGELVRADVELAVAQRFVFEHERDGVGRAVGLLGEQLPGWWRPGSAARCRSRR